MKTHIRRKQYKNFKHQDIKQKEPPQKPHILDPLFLGRLRASERLTSNQMVSQ